MKIKLTKSVLIVAATILIGCESKPERLPTFAVTGKVTENGKPVANAQVIFHPVDATKTDKPRGKTDANGAFQLTTYDGNDGVPVGKYRVTVELWQTLKPDEGPVSRLPAKYAKPETSGFTAEVSSGPVDLPAFEIKK